MRDDSSPKSTALAHLRIMRFDHWLKNFLMFPGVALGLVSSSSLNYSEIPAKVSLSFLALCLASSANYSINEFLDRAQDSIHPLKNHRIANKFKFEGWAIFLQFSFLTTFSLMLANLVSWQVFFSMVILVLSGVFYNVHPIRVKDVAYFDVLLESLNNPIRFCVGWFAVNQSNPVPVSAFISFWAMGIFLMSLKRYVEIQLVNDGTLLKKYRKSFNRWTAKKLLVFSFLGAFVSAAFLGILITKYRIEYALLLIPVCLLFKQYLEMSINLDPASFAPEKLYRRPRILFSALVIGISFIALTFLDLPAFRSFVYP